MHFEKAERLRKLPPYLFAEIDRKKKEAIRAGRDVINLGIGDPDQPTPKFIIDELARAAYDPRNHQYALCEGLPALREACAGWYARRFGVRLDPETEIWPLIGSKEGIAHLPLALLDPGDAALIPEPGYPPYLSGTIFAGGKPFLVPLKKENYFLPDLEELEKNLPPRAKLLFLNYPNNPTAAVAGLDFYERVVAFARRNNIIVASDAAYTEIYYEEPPVSFLQAEGAREVGVEFHSLSKTFNMTGWRIGFAVGNREVVAALGQLKSNLDSGIFQAIQEAAIAALNSAEERREDLLRIYRRRRDVLVEGLRGLGWNVEVPKATFYVWSPIPNGIPSAEFAEMLLEKADIVVTPGIGFGPSGEGYIRAALTIDEQRIREAVERIRRLRIQI